MPNINNSTTTTTTTNTALTTRSRTIALDGYSLTAEDLYAIGYHHHHHDDDDDSDDSTLLPVVLTITEEARRRIVDSRSVIDGVVQSGVVKYGINTGFGAFASTVIAPDKLCDLQKNLIRSHASGVGEPLSIARARMLKALRINVFCRGHSGISVENVDRMLAALNRGCVARVPSKGSVGASGDLAPLSHIALGMLGEGHMWNPRTERFEDAASVLREHGLQPIELGPKEGLALINGTQFIAALGAEAVVRAKNIARQADVVAALTLEALQGSSKAFDARVHRARPHTGQIKVARRMRGLLLERRTQDETNGKNGEANGQQVESEIAFSHRNCNRVQDSYTLRCIPQVHGVVIDTVSFVEGIMSTELNSSTDNPMIFTDEDGCSEIDGWDERVVSGGNFHGEYPAKAMDYLAIAVHELCTISERRIARLIDTHASGLPAFLVKEGGLNSGFMLAHVTAAALCSENKVLVHPSSADTIPTSANKEDHVSMGPYAAMKALTVLENVEHILAIELLCACQALEFLRPLKTTRVLERVHALVREHVPKYVQDRFMTPDIEAAHRLLVTHQVWDCVKEDLEDDIH